MLHGNTMIGWRCCQKLFLFLLLLSAEVARGLSVEIRWGVYQWSGKGPTMKIWLSVLGVGSEVRLTLDMGHSCWDSFIRRLVLARDHAWGDELWGLEINLPIWGLCHCAMLGARAWRPFLAAHSTWNGSLWLTALVSFLLQDLATIKQLSTLVLVV
jgi:hypothetical protein